MGFLDSLFGSSNSARRGAAGAAERVRPARLPERRSLEPAAAQRGRDRRRALPLPPAHRASRDDRTGARRGVLEAHRAAAPARARGALGRAAAAGAAAVDRAARDGARRDARRVHEPRVHGAHARTAASGPTSASMFGSSMLGTVVGFVVGSRSGQLVHGPRVSPTTRATATGRRMPRPAATARRRPTRARAGATPAPAGAATRRRRRRRVRRLRLLIVRQRAGV